MVAVLVAFLLVMFPADVAAAASEFQAKGLVFTASIGMVGLVSLANLDADSEGEANPGGTRKLLIIHAKDVVGVWPKKSDIVNGEIINPPVLIDGAGFAEYNFPDSTFDLMDAQEGDPGFQSFKHSAGFMFAGYSKKVVAEVLKHLNAGSIIIGQLNDDVFAVAGSSDNAIYVKSSFSSGKKGSDKRGYTFKGEQDGFMWGVTPLKETVVATLELLPIVP